MSSSAGEAEPLNMFKLGPPFESPSVSESKSVGPVPPSCNTVNFPLFGVGEDGKLSPSSETITAPVPSGLKTMSLLLLVVLISCV